MKNENLLIDCFLFNGEYDILELRLHIMNPFVDKFILVEANKTFTGISKNNLFGAQSERFEAFKDKLTVVTLQDLPSTNDPWENEFYMRNALLNASGANDDDLVIISDVDEILNLEKILPLIDRSKSYVIEIPCYYYFANIRSSEVFSVNYIGPFSKIKNQDIGNRLMFRTFVDEILPITRSVDFGAHLTYQFGSDVAQYQKKLVSFSHQEFNQDYFTNGKKIKNKIRFSIDLYDRWKFRLTYTTDSKFSASLRHLVHSLEKNKIEWKKWSLFDQVARPFVLLSFKSYRKYQKNRIISLLANLKNKITSK